MQSVKQRDTKAEVAIRRLLHARGLRYRVDRPVVGAMRRRVDISFPTAKVAVFVDGCFWHSCPIHGTVPKANAEWWAEKLATNRRRDADTDMRLRDAGWKVVRVWEHESPARAAQHIAATVRRRRALR